VEFKPTIMNVTLTVADLARSVEFYETNLGLKPRKVEGAIAYLGAGAGDLLILEEHADAPRPGRTTGLFHTAFLLPSRAALARQLQHLAQLRTPIQGMADHLVSEAIYLADPEGNGIELYSDRPRSNWIYNAGQIRMTAEPLDVENLLAEAGSSEANWRGMPIDTTVGHIHLRVADVDAAETFYRQVLGFDLTTRYGRSASFLSVNGYHHHVGLNTWESLGAPPAPPGARGLKHFEVRLNALADLKRIEDVATKAGLPTRAIENGLGLRDPSGNSVIVRAAEGFNPQRDAAGGRVAPPEQ
jgi:catechol 2,3-dioxygenase